MKGCFLAFHSFQFLLIGLRLCECTPVLLHLSDSSLRSVFCYTYLHQKQQTRFSFYSNGIKCFTVFRYFESTHLHNIVFWNSLMHFGTKADVNALLESAKMFVQNCLSLTSGREQGVVCIFTYEFAVILLHVVYLFYFQYWTPSIIKSTQMYMWSMLMCRFDWHTNERTENSKQTPVWSC